MSAGDRDQSRGQFSLLRERRFAPFFATQFLGAANDNVFKYAFTLLVTVYGEVSAAGAWLWRDEDAAARFPSLYVVGRPAPARAASKPQDGGTGEPAAPPAQGTG